MPERTSTIQCLSRPSCCLYLGALAVWWFSFHVSFANSPTLPGVDGPCTAPAAVGICRILAILALVIADHAAGHEAWVGARQQAKSNSPLGGRGVSDENNSMALLRARGPPGEIMEKRSREAAVTRPTFTHTPAQSSSAITADDPLAFIQMSLLLWLVRIYLIGRHCYFCNSISVFPAREAHQTSNLLTQKPHAVDASGHRLT